MYFLVVFKSATAMKRLKGVPCYACRPGREWADFHRVLAKGDVGLTIYRHRESANKRCTSSSRADTSGVSARETIIFYTTRPVKAEQHREMNQEIFSADLPKCVNYCARCKEMMRRIEVLFRNKPHSTRGTDLCELFSCPPCTEIVTKLRAFAAESAIKKHDSELIHLHRLATPNFDDDVKSRSVLDDPKKAEIMKSAGMPGILKDNEARTKNEEKERGRDTSVKGLERQIKGKQSRTDRTTKSLKESKEKSYDLKTTASEIKKDRARKDRKVVSSTDKTGKGMVTAIGAKGDGISSKVVKERKLKEAKKTKQGKETSPSASKKELISKPKSDFDKQGGESNKNPKIDKHMRSHEREREQDKKRKDIEDKMRQANLAEEKARRRSADAHLARQSKFKQAMQQIAIPEQESVSLNTLECPQESQDAEAHGFIKGTKLYMAHKQEPVNREKAADPLTVIHRSKSPPPRPRNAEQTSAQSGVPPKSDGVIQYKLSERRFVRKGWTQLPKEMVMRKVAVFLMRPARQKFDWLEVNKPKGRVLYHSGEELATFDENGTRLYYKNGGLALEYYQAEETNAGERVVVYSSGEPQNGRARPRTVLAVFDYSGNGAVYDHAGNVRLKYSQTEGVVLDKNIGPHTHWKWHNLNDSSLLQTVQLETHLQCEDPEILESKDDIETQSEDTTDETEEVVMKRIETQKIIEEKKRLAKEYSPLQIKMKAFKINECFSLRISEQKSIYLSFSDGKTFLKINVGLILDPSVVVAVDYVEVGEVTNSLERPASSASVERLQRAVRAARGAESARVLRERRLNGTPSYLMERRRHR